MPEATAEGNQASGEVFLNMSNGDTPSTPKTRHILDHYSFFNVPQSRFSEFIYPVSIESDDDETEDEGCGPSAVDSEFLNPLSFEPDDEIQDDDPDFDDYDLGICFPSSKPWHARPLTRMDVAIVAAAISVLVSSLTVPSLKHHAAAGIHMWKFALLLLVVSGGRIISPYIARVSLSIIQRSISMRRRTRYYLYSVQPAFTLYTWLLLIEIVWVRCFDKSTPLSPEAAEIYCMDQLLPATLLAIAIWHFRRIVLDLFTSSFYLALFYDRMKGVAFHLYMLEAIMGPQLDERNPTVLEAKSVRSRSKKLGRITALAFSTSRLPRHVADRMLLAHIEGCKTSEFEATSHSKILRLARQAFRRVGSGKE